MAAAGRKSSKTEALPLDRWVAYRCGLVATRMGAISAKLFVGPHDLSASAWRAMAVVARFEPLSAATLSEHTRLDPSKISRAIEVLVGRKLLTRHKDPDDQRKAVLRLTARGREIYRSIEAEVVEFEARITSTLSAAENKALWSALDKIDGEIARYRESP